MAQLCLERDISASEDLEPVFWEHIHEFFTRHVPSFFHSLGFHYRNMVLIFVKKAFAAKEIFNDGDKPLLCNGPLALFTSEHYPVRILVIVVQDVIQAIMGMAVIE